MVEAAGSPGPETGAPSLALESASAGAGASSWVLLDVRGVSNCMRQAASQTWYDGGQGKLPTYRDSSCVTSTLRSSQCRQQYAL